jgi:hypothetical protein
MALANGEGPNEHPSDPRPQGIGWRRQRQSPAGCTGCRVAASLARYCRLATPEANPKALIHHTTQDKKHTPRHAPRVRTAHTHHHTAHSKHSHTAHRASRVLGLGP